MSAFGFGGTDFHLVLEEYTGEFLPSREPALDPWPTELFLWRGETPSAFLIREARADEVDALARLHVVTWAATYPEVLRPPTFAIRSWQWRELFAQQD